MKLNTMFGFKMCVCFCFKKHYVTPRAKQVKIEAKDQSLNPKAQNILADQVTALYCLTYLFMLGHDERSNIKFPCVSLGLSPSPWAVPYFLLSGVSPNNSGWV